MGGFARVRRTVKPGVAAQTLSPAALMMAALSRWPVPTRLYVGSHVLAHHISFPCPEAVRILKAERPASHIGRKQSSAWLAVRWRRASSASEEYGWFVNDISYLVST